VLISNQVEFRLRLSDIFSKYAVGHRKYAVVELKAFYRFFAGTLLRSHVHDRNQLERVFCFRDNSHLVIVLRQQHQDPKVFVMNFDPVVRIQKTHGTTDMDIVKKLEAEKTTRGIPEKIASDIERLVYGGKEKPYKAFLKNGDLYRFDHILVDGKIKVSNPWYSRHADKQAPIEVVAGNFGNVIGEELEAAADDYVYEGEYGGGVV